MTKFLLIPALCLLSYGCVSEDQARSIAMNKAAEHCSAEGKQFVFRNTSTKPGSVPDLITDVSVSGYCVTPEQKAFLEKQS